MVYSSFADHSILLLSRRYALSTISFVGRMGPLHLADYIGLDTCLFIVEGEKGY